MTITHRDHTFEPYITAADLQKRTAELGQAISAHYQGKNPLLLCVLNGAFMFAADLMRAIRTFTEIGFVKYSSYEGMESTGTMKEVLGIQQNLEGRHVIIIEDIIDTGRTIKYLIDKVKEQQPASVAVASCLLKPEALEDKQGPHMVNYLGFEIPNDFVIGYGLDFDGFGRNLPDIYRLTKQ